jgi:hypothetical protein
MICARQQQLMDEAQSCLVRIADLARAEAEALTNGTENIAMEIDRQIEHAIGEKERAIGALREHRKEHGC